MSPVFGRMSTKHGYRRVLMISSALVVFGALFYAVVNSVFGVFLSQVFLGTCRVRRGCRVRWRDARPGMTGG